MVWWGLLEKKKLELVKWNGEKWEGKEVIGENGWGREVGVNWEGKRKEGRKDVKEWVKEGEREGRGGEEEKEEEKKGLKGMKM